MSEEIVGGLPDGETAEALIANLKEALEFEQMKNQFLVEKLIEAEDANAEREVEAFADVVPEEDTGFWAGQLVTNREGALAALGRLRERVKGAANVKETPAEVKGKEPAATVPPKPLHNRAAAKVEVADAPAEASVSARLARVTARAKELVRNRRIAFDVAWRCAEAELKEG